jgi:hypothetical protein
MRTPVVGMVAAGEVGDPDGDPEQGGQPPRLAPVGVAAGLVGRCRRLHG